LPTATLVDVPKPILLLSPKDGLRSSTVTRLVLETTSRLVEPPVNTLTYSTRLPLWQTTLQPSTATKVVTPVSLVSLVLLGLRPIWISESVKRVARS
jgi:hypothetical protein